MKRQLRRNHITIKRMHIKGAHVFILNGLALALVAVIGLISLNTPTTKLTQNDSSSMQPTPPPAPTTLPELPFGGRQLLPSYRLVALYGTPSFPTLGALGEQNLDKTLVRAKKLAKAYQAFSQETVVPAFEIIATVASSTPTSDGDYSREIEVSKLKSWVDAAHEHGIYVVLDLQSGRESFLSQAKQYEELLKQPHVGLALDPEWRLKSNQVHLAQIGSVDAKEINRVADWLAGLTKTYDLPQKLLLLHYFKASMITNPSEIKTSHPELALVTQMDGHGSPAEKDDTWRVLTARKTKGMRYGWKNFYDEDKQVRSPAATMKVEPKPWFVSYQ